VIILGISTLFGQAAFAAHNGDKAAGKSANVAGAKAKAAKALNLTADQKTKIKAILADAKTKAAAVKADTSLTPQAKKDQLKAIRKAANDQIMQLLTPEQQQTWKKIHKKSKAKGWMAKLGLTEEQKAKIKAIFADSKTQIKAVKADTSLSTEAKKAKIKQIRADALAKVRAVLTAEQQAKLDAARAAKKK